MFSKCNITHMPRAVKNIFLIISIILFLSACATRRDFILPGEGPEVLYQMGYDAMVEGDFQDAIAYYRALQGRFPFSTAARQSQLDTIYIHFRSGDRELAISSSEGFESENPTHPRVDYALYMRGISYFDRERDWLERRFNVDLNVRPPRDTMLAFSTFQELLRRYPNSPYASDSRNRMIFLRDRLAAYEKSIADFYYDRGAYVGAINRANALIERYPGAPVIEDSLLLIQNSYLALGLNDEANAVNRILDLNF